MCFLGSNLRRHIAHALRFYSLHHFWKSFLEVVEYVGSSQVHARFTLLRQAENLVKSLFFRRMAIVSAVVFLNFQFFLFREPITLALFQLKLQLGIKLSIVNGRTINSFLHFNTEETAAACLVY